MFTRLVLKNAVNNWMRLLNIKFTVYKVEYNFFILQRFKTLIPTCHLTLENGTSMLTNFMKPSLGKSKNTCVQESL